MFINSFNKIRVDVNSEKSNVSIFPRCNLFHAASFGAIQSHSTLFYRDIPRDRAQSFEKFKTQHKVQQRALSDWMHSLVSFARDEKPGRFFVERMKETAATTYIRIRTLQKNIDKTRSLYRARSQIKNHKLFASRRITRCIKLSPDVNFGGTSGALARQFVELRASQSEQGE